jgi:hypothetical protein
MLSTAGYTAPRGRCIGSLFLCIPPGSGWCRKKLVPLLEERRHSVRTPTLTGLGERSHLAHPGIVMRTHIDDVTSVLTYDDLRGVILAGDGKGEDGRAASHHKIDAHPPRLDAPRNVRLPP